MNDSTKTQTELLHELKTLEVSSNLIKLDEEFDSDSFDTTINTISTLTNSLDTNGSTDISSSLDMIQEQLKASIENNTSVSDAVSDISNNIDKYKVEQAKEVVLLDPPMLPNLIGLSMPDLLDSNGSQILFQK